MTQCFLFNSSIEGPDNSYFNKFPGDAAAADLETILENYCSEQMYKTGIKGKREK